MTTLEPWVVGNTPVVEPHPTTNAALSADMKTFAAFKDTVKATPIKTVLESVIVVLTLVRVRVPVLSPFSHPLIGDITRTR